MADQLQRLRDQGLTPDQINGLNQGGYLPSYDYFPDATPVDESSLLPPSNDPLPAENRVDYPIGNELPPEPMPVVEEPLPPEPVADPNQAAAMEYMKATDPVGYERLYNALNQEALLAKDLGEREAQLQESYAKEAANIALKQQEIDDQYAIDAGEYQTQIDADIKELNDTKIDSGRFWANKSTGDKVLAVGASFLGGFAAGFSGNGSNRALDTINTLIERDIAEQKTDYMRKKEGIDQKRSAFAMMKDKYKSDTAALLGTKAAALENVQNQFKTMAARHKGTEAAVNAEKAIAQLEIQKKAAQDKMTMELLKQQSKAGKDMREYYVKDAGLAYNKEDARELRTSQAEYNTAQKTIDEAIAMIDKFDLTDKYAPSKLHEKLKQANVLLRGNMRKMIVGSGTLTEQDFDRIAEAIPVGDNINDFSKKTATEALRSLGYYARLALDQQMKAKVEGYQGWKNKELGSSAQKVE